MVGSKRQGPPWEGTGWEARGDECVTAELPPHPRESASSHGAGPRWPSGVHYQHPDGCVPGTGTPLAGGSRGHRRSDAWYTKRKVIPHLPHHAQSRHWHMPTTPRNTAQRTHILPMNPISTTRLDQGGVYTPPSQPLICTHYPPTPHHAIRRTNGRPGRHTDAQRDRFSG